MCCFFGLASFIQHNYLDIHLCCCMYSSEWYISLFGYTTICLSMLSNSSVMDIWVVSSLELLQMKLLLWTFMYSLCVDIGFHFLDINLFNFSRSDKCQVISHCSLICIFSRTNDVEHLFMCLFAIHISSLVKCPAKSFGHIFIVSVVFLF